MPSFGDPPALTLRVGLAVLLLVTPAASLHGRRDTPLIVGTDPSRLEPNCLPGDLTNKDAIFADKVFGNAFFPDVGFVAAVLFALDVLALELVVGPPPNTSTKRTPRSTSRRASRQRRPKSSVAALPTPYMSSVCLDSREMSTASGALACMRNAIS